MPDFLLWYRRLPAVHLEAQEETAGAWASGIASNFSDAGVDILHRIGGSVAGTFARTNATVVLHTALEQILDGESLSPPVRATIGVTTCTEDPDMLDLHLDTAQLLANRGRAGEIVLSEEATHSLAHVLLFDRTVRLGVSGLRGVALDREYPWRQTAVQSVASVVLPNPGIEGFTLFDPFIEKVREFPGQWHILRGDEESGCELWVQAAKKSLSPAWVMHLAPVPGAWETLGSLRLSLAQQWAGPKDIEERVPRKWRPIAQALISGSMAPKEEVIAFLTGMFDAAPGWVFIDPLSGVDPSSSEVVFRAASASKHTTVIARLEPGARLPAAVQKAVASDTDTTNLDAANLELLAQLLLGKETSAEIVQKVVRLAQPTVRGVLETVRTIISTADVVPRDGSFRWRKTPRMARQPLPTTSMLDEQFGAFRGQVRRLLECIAICPHGTPNEIQWIVMRSEGIEPERCMEIVDDLQRLHILAPSSPLRFSNPLPRKTLLNRMSLARRNALRMKAAEALDATADERVNHAAGTRAFFYLECGENDDAATAFLQAAKAAVECDFSRASLRLAAAAVRAHGTPEVQAEAQLIENANRETEKTVIDATTLGAGEALTRSNLDQLWEAIEAGNEDGVETLLDTMQTRGMSAQATDRIRALAYLKFGKWDAAATAMQAAEHRAAEPAHRNRQQIVRSMVKLAAGRIDDAVLDILAVLERVRTNHDLAGEAAALAALSSVNQAASNPEQSQRLLQRARTLQKPST